MEYMLFPLFVIKIIKSRNYHKSGLEIPLGMFLFSIYISSIGAFHSKSVIDNLKGTFNFFGLPILISQFDIDKKDRKRIIYISLLSFILKLSKGYLEKFGYIEGLYNGMRISGGEEVWRYAGVLMVGLVFLLSFLFFKKINRKKTVSLITLTLLTIMILIWTQNRGNWIGALGVLGLIFILKFKWKSFYLVVASMLIIGITFQNFSNNPYIQRAKSIVNISSNRSNLGRVELWQESVKIFRENSLKGIGYSTRNFANSEEPENYKNLDKRPYHHPHSSYFYLLATNGIIGFLSYLYLCSWELWKCFINRENIYGVTALLVKVSILIFGLVETAVEYSDIQGLFYLIFALLLLDQKGKKNEFSFCNK
ncbi:hypothetical protein PM10SUCC1_06790 [Propionigenium maris DSM 9537]|uniref:O-antigen ligase-related domain-containing protein n=1 Tax=Propionigenium maris DSM 9537 TaxID=1123000 RepID=A0A9W6GH62_9FUSO|nr:hypothetical protein PM10SUCC1_06790 [Propionigenium maris DSM 9537]